MESHATRLAVEPPIVLSAHARRSLDEERRRLAERLKNGKDVCNGTQQAQPFDSILERSWIDGHDSGNIASLPLSERLQKLWAERGDFSKFRASDLSANVEKQGGDLANESASNDDTRSDFGANLDGLVALIDDTEQEQGNEKQGVGSSGTAADTDIMSIEDMRQLRTQMLEKLGIAQTSLFFGHALVSLLVNSTKAGQVPSEGSRSGSRLGSPATGAGKLGGPTTAASTMHRSALTHQEQSLGSAGSLEAELGIEPHIFGASRIQSMQREHERPQRAEQDEHDKPKEDEDDEDDDDEGLESMERDLKRRFKEDARLLDDEVEDSLHDVVETYQGKREGLRSAVNILKHGADTLRQGSKSAARDHVRWIGLSQAKQSGWGLSPGKPIRGTASKRRELLEDANYRRREQPSRDAWVGYAVPEASAAQRRRALAYFSHADIEGKSPADALLFASRPRKRLHVELCVGQEKWSSRAQSSSSDSKGITLDSILCEAQNELVDAELFETIVGELRDSFLSQGISSARLIDSDSISVPVNEEVLLRIVMSDTSRDDAQNQKPPDSEQAERTTHYSSPLATLVLAFLRLGMVGSYRANVGLAEARTTLHKQTEQGAPLRLVLSLFHYASFVASLTTALGNLASRCPQMRYEMPVLVQTPHHWLQMLLLSGTRHSRNDMLHRMNGSAAIFCNNVLIARLGYAFPSHITLTLFKQARATAVDESASERRAVQLEDIDLAIMQTLVREALHNAETGTDRP